MTVRSQLLVIALCALLASAAAWSQTVPTVTLSANPTTGISPLAVTLTWSSTNASGCTASGGWSGAKATSGTQVVSDLRAPTTFSLECSSGTGSAQLSWTPPTRNTDGSNLTNLASYKVFHAATAAGVASSTAISIAAPASAYTVTGLPVGVRYYGIKAVNSVGIESALSNTVSNTVVLPSATASTSVTVNTQPEPPTLLTVATVARVWLPDYKGGTVSVIAGRVRVGTPCGEVTRGEWAMIAREDVRLGFFGRLMPHAILVAKCG